jgi:hypothetical protein
MLLFMYADCIELQSVVPLIGLLSSVKKSIYNSGIMLRAIWVTSFWINAEASRSAHSTASPTIPLSNRQ